MPDIIEPRVLKGFRDFLPEAEIERSALIEILERVFRSFGFVPIDTPVLEYAEILLGKGGGETDKQVYRFADNGGRDVAMRFDLTVPLARFMAEHIDELYLPFRRYHIAKVWRGENTQRGRYREFMQCDFDIVGSEGLDADFDIILLIRDAFLSLDVGGFSIRMNHRGLFNRFLAGLGLGEKSAAVLRLVDKLEKIGPEEVRKQLAEEAGEEAAAKVLSFITKEADFESTLVKLEALAGGPGPDSERLREMCKRFGALAGPDSPAKLVLDPSITRGLDYYTGVVFETSLDAMPEIGSVCSGGRYDELASLYTTRKLPGVGAAIGLDRLLAALEAVGRSKRRPGYTEVLILNLDEGLGLRYHELSSAFRRAGIACEVFAEKKKLAQQYGYAEKKGIPYAVILGSEEAARGALVLRELAKRENGEFPSAEGLIAAVKGKLGT
jgi:histidyl-tRNA synthetase